LIFLLLVEKLHVGALNLEIGPPNFPAPKIFINNKCTEGQGKFLGKSLAIWDIRELP